MFQDKNNYKKDEIGSVIYTCPTFMMTKIQPMVLQKIFWKESCRSEESIYQNVYRVSNLYLEYIFKDIGS